MVLEPLSSKVDVTAQAVPLDVESSPAPLTIVTREEIDQRDATSLPDLLATLPGFSLGRTGPEGGSASLFLDGGNSNYTMVLIDGTPANSPGGLIDFSNVSLDNVEKIEVVHGAESALYGSDAMDGVIQIFTRRGATRVPENSRRSPMEATSRRATAARTFLACWEDSITAVEAVLGVSDLESAKERGPNDAFRNRTLSGNFGWKFTDTARIGLALRDNISEAGTPGQTLLGPAFQTTVRYRLLCTISMRASTLISPRARTGSHQLVGFDSYNREFNARSVFSQHVLSIQSFRLRRGSRPISPRNSALPPVMSTKSKTGSSVHPLTEGSSI